MKSIFTFLMLALIYNVMVSQNIGIETTDPKAKLHLGTGDIFLEHTSQGLILKSPDGNCWKLGVNNAGLAVFSNVVCPNWQCGDTLNYGGEQYATVLIGSQCWMAENLNIGTMINGTVSQASNAPTQIIEKYCYDNNAANCNTYGGLYQWNEMMQYTTTEGGQGICPNGWHLPSNADWTALETTLPSPDKGSRLAGNAGLWSSGVLEQSQYFGSTGFNILPGGTSTSSGSFFNQTNQALFWTSTENPGNANEARTRYFYNFNTGVLQNYSNKVNGYSVRCIKD